MEAITLQGTLYSPYEISTNQNKTEYIIFTLACFRNDNKGRSIMTLYHCYTSDMSCKEMKIGDKVVVAGKLIVTVSSQGTTTLNVKTTEVTVIKK